MFLPENAEMSDEYLAVGEIVPVLRLNSLLLGVQPEEIQKIVAHLK